MTMNQVNLVARLGRDPEAITTKGGEAAAKFSCATSEYRKISEGQYDEVTEWHNVVVWDPKIAETVLSKVQKGTLISLTGKLSTRKYDKNGETQYRTEIVLPKFNGRLSVEADRKQSNGAATPAPAAAVDLDDIPL